MTISIFSMKFAGLINEAFILSCILDNQEWKYNVRQQAESITCKTATPTATPATGTKLASTHSSPARRHPRSKMLRSPGWEDKISLSTNYNQPPSPHAARELACTTHQQERCHNKIFFIKKIQRQCTSAWHHCFVKVKCSDRKPNLTTCISYTWLHTTFLCFVMYACNLQPYFNKPSTSGKTCDVWTYKKCAKNRSVTYLGNQSHVFQKYQINTQIFTNNDPLLL